MEIRLLIDTGNSQLKWVILFRKHPGAKLLATNNKVDVKDVLSKHKEWYLKKLILRSLKKLRKYSADNTELAQMRENASVSIASVAPNALNEVVAEELGTVFPQQNIRFVRTENNHEIITGSNNKLVFKINRENPKALGVDRWLAMIGLIEYLAKKKINTVFILSVGTATVLDKITIKKNKQATHTQEIIHEGGYIIPGFSFMESSLEFLISQAETKSFKPMEFPSCTHESVLSGICIVQAAISFISKSTTPVFLYGGNLDKFLAAWSLTKKLMQKESKIIVDPWLVFKGLNQLADGHPSRHCSQDFLQNS